MYSRLNVSPNLITPLPSWRFRGELAKTPSYLVVGQRLRSKNKSARPAKRRHFLTSTMRFFLGDTWELVVVEYCMIFLLHPHFTTPTKQSLRNTFVFFNLLRGSSPSSWRPQRLSLCQVNGFILKLDLVRFLVSPICIIYIKTLFGKRYTVLSLHKSSYHSFSMGKFFSLWLESPCSIKL